MRLLLIAGTIVALCLIACNGPTEPAPGTGPLDSPIETPEHTDTPSAVAPPTPRSSEIKLVETPAYTGVIISEDGASAFRYMFSEESIDFWQPTIEDVSRAEACIRRFFDSAQDNPNLDDYQKESAAAILEALEEYRRQYVGIVANGEERVWCNVFLGDPHQDWQRVPVDVDGGGDHYWQIEYNPLTDECTDFNVHGES